MAEFLDADKVLRELSISEADLTKLVSEGELIAFKDEISQKLRFLSSDVFRLKESVKGKIYLTIEEVEKLSTLHKADIMDMVSEGKLQAFRDVKDPGVMKFKKSDVIKLLKKNGGSLAGPKVEETKIVQPKIERPKVEKPKIEKPKIEKEQDIKSIGEDIKIAELKSGSTGTESADSGIGIESPDILEEIVEEKAAISGKEKPTGDIDTALPKIQSKESKKESDDLFLEIKEDNLDLNMPQEQEESLFKDESTSTEETDVDLGTLLDEGGTATKEKEEEVEEEVITSKLRRPTTKAGVPSFGDEGYEDSTLEMVIMFIILAVMIVIGVFVYDNFHVLERGKVVRPTDFTKQIGQQVASVLGVKDNRGNPIDLENALREEIGGKKR